MAAELICPIEPLHQVFNFRKVLPWPCQSHFIIVTEFYFKVHRRHDLTSIELKTLWYRPKNLLRFIKLARRPRASWKRDLLLGPIIVLHCYSLTEGMYVLQNKFKFSKIIQSCHMDLSNFLLGFVKDVTWIGQSYYKHLSRCHMNVFLAFCPPKYYKNFCWWRWILNRGCWLS